MSLLTEEFFKLKKCIPSVFSTASRCSASSAAAHPLASVLDCISMSFKSPVKLKRTLTFRAVELAMRADRVHERVVDQSVDVTLPLKEELSVDIPVPLGMEDIVKVVLSFCRAGGILGPRVDECNSRPSSEE